MAAPGWRTADPLARRLRQDYAHINFYQLVRLLLLDRKRRADVAPAAPPARELDAAVRFHANLDGAFPGREVCAVNDPTGIDAADADTAPRPIELVVNNYCVAGAQGPLPDPYTDWIRDQVRDGNRDTAAFLDLFNHRFNALRYRLKTRHRPALEDSTPERSPLADHLTALMGMLTPGLAEQLPLPRRALLGLAGLLSNARRSPPVLAAALRTYLGVPVEVQPLQGDWRPIGRSNRMALGQRNHRLGLNSFAGTKVWDEHADVGLVVGPMDYDRFIQLLPEKDEAAHGKFAALLRYLVDRRHGCRVLFLIRDDSRPQPLLTAAPDTRRPGLHLGHTAWCSAMPAPRLTADAEVDASEDASRTGMHLNQGAWCSAKEAARSGLRRVELKIPSFAPTEATP